MMFYVSTLGDDSWSELQSVPKASKTDGPFRMLGRARDECSNFQKWLSFSSCE